MAVPFQSVSPAEDISKPSSRSAQVSAQLENPLKNTHWDALASQLPETSIFYRAAWANVLAETYGFAPVYLRRTAADGTQGGLPMMEVASWLTGRRGVALPFTDECNALSISESCVSDLIQEALQIGRKRKWKYFEVRGGNNFLNNSAPSLTFHGHKLNLAAGADSLFNQFESSVRRAIRKAEHSGLRVEFSQTSQSVSAYYTLHCHTRKAHGLPPQPLNFFRNIQKHILAKDLGVIVTAKLQERPVAAAIYFHDGLTAVYKFGASLGAALDLRANNLVMWEAIKWLASKGVKELSFGRTSINNEGLRRYKLGWGTKEYAINYYKYDFRTDKVIVERDASTGWHNALFRALPIPLARMAGRILYRHIA